MNLNHLEYYVQIVKYGSITKAAKKIFISPSALIAALNSLEEELGYKLLIRSHKGVSTTPAGELVYQDLLQFFHARETWHSLIDLESIKKERVTLYVYPSIYETVIPQMCALFTTEYPNIDLTTYSLSSRKIDDLFLNQHSNIVICSVDKFSQNSLQLFVRNMDLEISLLLTDHYEMFYCTKERKFPNEISLDNYRCEHSVTNLEPALFQSEVKNYFSKPLTLYSFSHLFYHLLLSSDVTLLPTIFKQSIFYTTNQIASTKIIDLDILLYFYLVHVNINRLTPAEIKVIEFIRKYFENLSKS